MHRHAIRSLARAGPVHACVRTAKPVDGVRGGDAGRVERAIGSAALFEGGGEGAPYSSVESPAAWRERHQPPQDRMWHVSCQWHTSRQLAADGQARS